MNRFLARSKYFAVPIFCCAANSARAVEPAMPPNATQLPLHLVQQSPKDPVSVVPSNNPLEPLVVTGTTSIETRSLLEIVGAQAKMKFILGDGIKGRVSLSTRAQKLSDFLNTLGQVANFAWDRVGVDTIVVVPKPATPFFMIPAAPQPVPRVAPPNRFVIPSVPAQPNNQPNWRPFEFNGSTIYLVPLQTPQPPSLATTTPKASELESVKK